MTRVMVADDHAVVRQGIIRILKDHGAFEIVGEAETVDEVTSFFVGNECDVLLLDVNMRGQTSLETLKNLRVSHPQTHILVLSMLPEEQYALRFIKAGAAGYMTKDAAPEQLLEAVTRVAAGGHYLSSEMAERALFGRGDDTPHESLSDREFEVMLAIAKGKRIRQIGEDLGLSEKTVSTYRSRVLRKLECESNSDIVEYVDRHDLRS